MYEMDKWEYLLSRPYGNLTWGEKDELLKLLLCLTSKVKELEDYIDYSNDFL